MSKHTPRKCVKVFHRINRYLATKDNHDAWGMCATSAECRTVMTVMLMVMSGVDPHMICTRRGKLGRPLSWSMPVEAVQVTLRINILTLLTL
jgi:hypothetical protein